MEGRLFLQNIEDLFNKASALLQKKMAPISYATWVEHSLKPYAIIDNLVLFECVNHLLRDGIMRHIAVITESIQEVGSKDLTVEILCKEDLPKRLADIESTKTTDVVEKLNPKYSFDNFVVGEGNRFAHAVCLAVAETPAQSYNPLFIYGGVGLGKTHLMHAVGHYCHELYPDKKITYITSEDFTNELISALQSNRTSNFRSNFRNTDILLVDDIQFIAGKTATETEFFHTFNTLREAGKQIIMTSDKPPKEIKKLEERLCSRFEGGLVADIQRPEFETRFAILRKKTEYENLKIADDVLKLIATHIDTNVRELEGSLIRLSAYGKLVNKPITMELAQVALKEFFMQPESKKLTSESIIQVVSNFYSVNYADIIGSRRNHDIVFPRQVAIYFVREKMGLSLTKTGEVFGNRHHTTVMSSIDKVEKAIRNSQKDADNIDDIRRRINGVK